MLLLPCLVTSVNASLYRSCSLLCDILTCLLCDILTCLLCDILSHWFYSNLWHEFMELWNCEELYIIFHSNTSFFKIFLFITFDWSTCSTYWKWALDSKFFLHANVISCFSATRSLMYSKQSSMCLAKSSFLILQMFNVCL